MIDLKEQKYWTPLFILLLALTARLLFYYILARHYGSASFWGPFGDSGAYMQMAKNFSAGFGFSIMPSPPYLPEAGHVPVFPFVLGLFYGHLFLFHIFQILLSASSAVLIYFIAGKFFGNRAAVLSGLFLALDPVSVFHSNMLLTETVFTFLLLLSVMFLSFLSSAKIHSRLIILSAVFLGAATLTRPVGVLLPFFAVLMIFLEAKSDLKFKIRSSLLFLAIFGLILTPWLARNYKHFGQIIVSSLPAYNWYMYNAREFYALKNNLGKEEAKAIFQTKARAIRPTNISHDQVFLGKFYWEESWTIIRESPLAYASLHAVNTLAVFFSGGIEEIRSVFTGKASGANFTRSIWKGPKEIFLLLQNYPLEVLGKLGLLIFYAVVGYGWIRSRSMAQGKIFTLFLLLVLYFGLTTGAVAEPRFRVPAQPFIFLLFSVSFFSLFFPGKAAKISGSPGGLNGSVKLAFRQ